jgi:hypothetical protein
MLEVSKSKKWWDSLSYSEQEYHFKDYLREKERLNLLRATSIEDLDEVDIEEIYNDYHS